MPKIVGTSSELEVHGMARYFEQMHKQESIDVVKFMRRFVPGTLVGDLRSLTNRWVDLVGLDRARTAAGKARDFKEADRIRDELAKMGIGLNDSKDPKTGEIVTTWEVRAAGTAEAAR
jgi:cysteinyl-tRNA synthetase